MIISFTERGQTKVCTLQSNNKMINVEQKLITTHRDQMDCVPCSQTTSDDGQNEVRTRVRVRSHTEIQVRVRVL